MKKKLLYFLFIFNSIAPFQLIGQINSKYNIENYSDKDIGSSLVNWKIQQIPTGEMLVANTNGLIKYDGNNWELFLSDSTHYMSIAVDSKGVTYLGKNGDFGYLSSSINGYPKFVSLKNKLGDKFSLKSSVWDITITSKGVYFNSKQGVILWDGLEMKVWESNSKSNYSVISGKSNNTLFVIRQSDGTVTIINDKQDSTIVSDQLFKEEYIPFINELDSVYFVGFRNQGIICLNKSNNELNKNFYSNSFFKINRLFTPLRNIDSLYFIGSQIGGIAVLNKKYQIIDTINETKQLLDNAVRNINIDNQHNLWASLLHGISKIEISSPWSSFNNEDGLIGTNWSTQIKRLDSTIIIGTTKGAFFKSGNKFYQIEGIKSKVWDIETLIYNDNYYVTIASERGLDILNSDFKLLRHYDIIATNLIRYNSNSGKVIVGGTDGIYELNAVENLTLKRIMPFENKDQVISYSVEDANGNIWVGVKNVGVYKITINNSKEYQFELFNTKNGLSKYYNPAITVLNNNIYIGTGNGLYIYDNVSNSFRNTGLLDHAISNLTATNDSTFYITFHNNSNEQVIEKWVLGNETIIKKISDPFKKLKFTQIVSILPEENQTWFSMSDGLYLYNELDNRSYDISFNTLINKTSTRDSLIFSGTYSKTLGPDKSIIVLDQPKEYQPTLDYDHNTIRFEYSATFFEDSDKNEFSYFLDGNDKSWSSWSTENVKEYNNLDPGKYTFYVKSKNIYDKEGRTAAYHFTILAPWYMTGWAYAFFTICSGLFIWFVALAYTYRVRLQRRKLKLLVADRTFEVLSQKKEIEKQNEALKEQYEEIQQQRDAIDEKNQELEMSQEEILSINDKLQELNTSLEKKVDERTTEIKATVKKLQSSIAELDTFIYRASHDLKGPISRINGLTSLAKLETSSLNDIKYYNLIELVAKDMNKLLAKLTQVHEVINCDPELEWVDMPVLITEIRNSINFLDPDEKTKYSFVLESTLQVKSDPYLLSVILTNLMENSLLFKNTSNKISEVKISSNQTNDTFIISVEDNGIGIPVEHIDKVFNMFYRGSDQSKGSGLGLYLAQMAVEKLDGTINVESEYGKYTKFTITLPKRVN